MIEDDKNELRELIRVELADLRNALAPILDRLDALQPHIAGLTTLGVAIEVLQRDVRGLRDDMRVTSAMVQRADGTLTDMLTELNRRALEST